MTTQQIRPFMWCLNSACCVVLLISFILTAPAHGQNTGDTTISARTIGAPEPVSVECRYRSLAAAAFDFAFNPATGELAAIETEFGRLWVYPPEFMNSTSAPAPRTMRIGTRPVSIVWKECHDRSYFLVICETNSEMVVLDATTLEEVHRSKLPVRDLTRLWTSQNPDDPNVYYGYQLLSEGGVRRIATDTWEDAGTVAEPGTLHAVSGDGRYVVVVSDGRTGSQALSIDNGRIVQTRPSHCRLQSHLHVCVPDPHGQMLFVGQRFPFQRTEVWRADLSRQMNRLDTALLTVSPTRPWLAGYRQNGPDTSLVFAEYPSLGAVVELAYPGTPLHVQLSGQTVQFANRQLPRQFSVFSDERREQLLIAFNEHVTVVPLDDLNLPDGDVLHVDVPLYATAETGEELRIPVQGLSAGADVQLRNPPNGVRIEESAVRWTPTNEQIGRHAIELDITRGDDTAHRWIEVAVDRPSTTLGGLSSNDPYIDVDPTGRRLLMAAPDAAGQMELRLIDLETGEATASALLPPQSQVRTLQFPGEDGENLIVFHGTSVSSMPWPHLEPVTTYTFERTIQDLVLVGNQWAVGKGRRNGVERWRLSDGELVPFPPLIGGIHERTRNGEIASISQEVIGSRFADGWISEGVLYDNRLQTARLLLRPWGFIRSERLDLTPLLRRDGDKSPPQTAASNAPNRLLVDFGRMQLEMTRDSSQFVPPAGPLQNVQIVKLNLWTLSPAELVESKPFCLMQEPGYGVDVRAFPAGSNAAIIVKDRLYLWATPISQPLESDAQEPAVPQFELEQSHLEADAVATTVFEHRVTGGLPPYRFAVRGPRADREVLQLPVDAETGNVTVSGSQAAEWVMTRLRGPLEGAGSGAKIDAYREVADAEFEKIVGHPPAGIPVLLGMSVTVTDSVGQEATLPYEFFVEVPRNEWSSRLRQTHDRQQQAVADRREAELAAMQQRQQEEVLREQRRQFGLEPQDEPLSPNQILWQLLLVAGVSLLALPLHVPISAVFLRAAFSIEMRFVMPDADEVGTEATWGRALLASLATQGAMIFVGFFISLYTQVGANLALLAPLYTAALTIAQTLVAQWSIQALMVKLILQLRWPRALRVSFYQILIALLIAAIVVGTFALILTLIG